MRQSKTNKAPLIALAFLALLGACNGTSGPQASNVPMIVTPAMANAPVAIVYPPGFTPGMTVTPGANPVPTTTVTPPVTPSPAPAPQVESLNCEVQGNAPDTPTSAYGVICGTTQMQLSRMFVDSNGNGITLHNLQFYGVTDGNYANRNGLCQTPNTAGCFENMSCIEMTFTTLSNFNTQYATICGNAVDPQAGTFTMNGEDY